MPSSHSLQACCRLVTAKMACIPSIHGQDGMHAGSVQIALCGHTILKRNCGLLGIHGVQNPSPVADVALGREAEQGIPM